MWISTNKLRASNYKEMGEEKDKKRHFLQIINRPI
jgi:hypothetical protein